MAGSNELCGLTVITEICKKEHIRGNAEILKQLLAEFCETPVTNLIENADVTSLGGGQFEIAVIEDPREGYIAITEDLMFYEFDGIAWALKFSGLGDFVATATDNGDDTYTFTSFDGNTSFTITIPLLSIEAGPGIDVDATDPRRPQVGLNQASQDSWTKADNAIPSAEKGAANGVATLDANALIPTNQLPPYAISELIEATETTIAAFAANSASYTFQPGGVILIDDGGNLLHYFYKGGGKTDVGNYSPVSATQIDWSNVTGKPTTLAGYGITDAPIGIQTFDSLTDALASNPPNVFQVGMNLLTRKIPHPVLKSDFSLINSNTEPKKTSKLEKVRYVDLGDWRLKLITTDKKFIFANEGDIRYTYDIEECLVSSIHPTEDRYTFDYSKLTPMFSIATRALSIRELGNRELVIQKYGTSHYYTTNNQTVANESGSHPETVGGRIDGWAFDAYGDTVVFSTYAPAPDRGGGSVILSTDGGKTYDEVFNIIDDAPAFFPEVPLNSIHLHGCFIDPYREDIYVIVGDYSFNETTPGKILVLENYRSNTEWQMLPHNFKDGPREQYCTGIALEKNILFGTDMHETCISRMNIGEDGILSTREWADRLHIGLDYIPNFTRPVEPNAPIGIHYSCIGGANPAAPLSQIVLTKDGFNFANIYMDTFEKRGFNNNNARVWCTVDGSVYCTQFNGRFPNELIMGKYNGFNMV